MEKKILLVPVLLFIIANFLGLLAASQLLVTTVVEETPITNTSPISGLYFFLSLMVATAIILVLYKFKINFLIKAWFYLALFSTTFLFFGAFLELIPTIIISFLLVLGRIFIRNFILRNIIYVFAFAGAGSFFGVTLGLIPSLIILGLLSIYDIVAVHLTKHMVFLAKSEVQTDTLMGFMYPKSNFKTTFKSKKSGKSKMGVDIGVLGGGDVIVPMIFAIAIFKSFGIWASICTIIMSAAFLTILFIKAQQGKVYPGLPAVCTGAVTGFLLWLGLSALI